MAEQTEKTFIGNMAIVVVILIVFTLGIIFLAKGIGSKDDSVNNPSRQTTTEERIRPVAGVYTGETGAAAIQEAASSTATETKVAFDGSLDGEMIYASVCSACHATGAAGAPKPGSPEWAPRAEKGQDVLVLSVLNGLNAMPPRAGRADLSDEQVQAAVEFMLK